MTKGYLLENDGCHMSFKCDGDDIKLFYSRKGNWTEKCKGKLALHLKDTGNDFAIELEDKRVIILDVCQLHYLLQAIELLKIQKPGTFSKYKKVVSREEA